MALDTYGDLKDALPSWLMETDAADIVDRIDEFFALAHQRIFYGCGEAGYESDPLRIRFMEDTADLTVNAQTIALPSDWLQTRRLYLDGTPLITPKQCAPAALWEEFPTSTTGRPQAFAIEGSNIVFGPVPDATYTGKLLYYAMPDVPTDDADTNWLMTNAPGVYLRAAQVEAWSWLEEEEEAQKAAAKLAGQLRALQRTDTLDRWTGPPTGRRIVGRWTP